MIKIETIDLKNISIEYFSKIKDRCLERAEFLELLLDVLLLTRPVSDISSKTLHGATKKSLCNLLLNSLHKLGKTPDYSRFRLANCKPWVNNHIGILAQIARYLKDQNNLKDLVLASAEQCYQKSLYLNNLLSITGAIHDEVSEFITKIIDYSLLDSHAYWLGSKLGVNTCPYCNRCFIHTIVDKNKENVIRPTLDHFYPQSRHPFLSLSFYNLIPSCYYCNSSLKKDIDITPDTHLNPYLEGFEHHSKFRVLVVGNKPAKSDPENYHIRIQPFIDHFNAKYRKIFGNIDSEGNINLFRLNELYASHRDVVGELIVKCDKYSGGYANSLHEIFGKLGTDKSEFYQFYFGNYLNDKDFHRRPLAKMTKDVVEQALPNFFK